MPGHSCARLELLDLFVRRRLDRVVRQDDVFALRGRLIEVGIDDYAVILVIVVRSLVLRPAGFDHEVDAYGRS
jgi:hypothetical protein